MSKKLFLYLVVIGLATACAYYTIEFISERAVPLPFYGVDDHTVPSFEYTNQLGNTFSSEDHNDKIWIVDYFFTSCPTICPIMTKNLQEVHERIRNDKDVMILSFTVDPKRDQPPRLLNYAEKHRANHDTWQFLTGDKTSLYRHGRTGFLLSSGDGGGDDGFIHSENIVVVDQDQRIRGFFNGTDSKAPKQIMAAINKLRREMETSNFKNASISQ